MKEEHVLKGKTIKEIKIKKDGLEMMFLTNDDESILAKCDADCCSYTWIEHIELPSYDFPLLVTNVEDIDMPDLGNTDGCEVVAYYGLKISTEKGDIVIDYRNDSNGYYGGWISFGNSFYGGVYGQQISEEKEWVDAKEYKQ